MNRLKIFYIFIIFIVIANKINGNCHDDFKSCISKPKKSSDAQKCLNNYGKCLSIEQSKKITVKDKKTVKRK